MTLCWSMCLCNLSVSATHKLCVLVTYMLRLREERLRNKGILCFEMRV